MGGEEKKKWNPLIEIHNKLEEWGKYKNQWREILINKRKVYTEKSAPSNFQSSFLNSVTSGNYKNDNAMRKLLS